MTSRHGVCRWTSSENRRWAHSLVDPIGQRGNPRPCVRAHRESPPPDPYLYLFRDSTRVSIFLSLSPRFPLYLRFTPTHARASSVYLFLATRRQEHRRAADNAAHTQVHRACLHLHLYLHDDECMRVSVVCRDTSLPVLLSLVAPKLLAAYSLAAHTLGYSRPHIGTISTFPKISAFT